MAVQYDSLNVAETNKHLDIADRPVDNERRDGNNGDGGTRVTIDLKIATNKHRLNG